jgi:hypothetical protein
VNGVGFGRDRVGDHPHLGGDPPQLGVDVLPLTDPPVVEEVLFAHLAELAGGAGPTFLAQVVPQAQPAEQVGLGVGEASVPLGRLLFLVAGAFPRVEDREGRRDHQHLPQAGGGVGCDHHPGQSGIDRHPGEASSQIGEPTRIRIEGAQLLEQRHAVADVAGVRWVQKRVGLDVPEPQGGHLQDDRSQVGALDLGLGELVAAFEVVL